MIAALFVDASGVYSGLPDVDLWDEARDARRYAGPYPVVAHPPCSRWCRLAGLVEARWGYRKGDDNGCFAAALAAVRRWGGVLEHPAYSDAWTGFGLPIPDWIGWQVGIDGGATCHVEQGRYGHPAKKATWLYSCQVPLERLPSLDWGRQPDSGSAALVSWCGNHTKRNYISITHGDRPGHQRHVTLKRHRVGKKTASATPLEFRDLLLSIARAVNLPAHDGEAV